MIDSIRFDSFDSFDSFDFDPQSGFLIPDLLI